jgi:hypothetical protein
MSEVWVLLGITGNVILFVWGVLYLAKAIRDSNKDDGL